MMKCRSLGTPQKLDTLRGWAWATSHASSLSHAKFNSEDTTIKGCALMQMDIELPCYVQTFWFIVVCRANSYAQSHLNMVEF